MSSVTSGSARQIDRTVSRVISRQSRELAARGESPASHRGRRCARMARREERAYREYVSDEQRSQTRGPQRGSRVGVEEGCSAGRMQLEFHHGLLCYRMRSTDRVGTEWGRSRDGPYSYLSALTGSSRVARLAGHTHAAIDTTIISSAIDPMVTGSRGLVCTSRICSSLPTPNAPAMPSGKPTPSCTNA